ncbi:MAG: glycosyltransferase family 4 protein [Hyphomonadaceae bacterium]|nr:glycosyltransferase family 4 protein [Hyphomonadaceae bacterium]
MRKLLFVATEDWFVRSHFLPMVARAKADGWETVVAARVGDAAKDLEAAGARVAPLSGVRGRLSPGAVLAEAAEMRRVLKEERPDLIHAIALKPCFVVSLAMGAAPDAGIAFAITGMGYLSARDLRMRLARAAALQFIADAAQRRSAIMVLENDHDRRKFEKRGVRREMTAILPGAGIDPARLTLSEPPSAPPIRVGLAARLLRSKGIEDAIEAVQILRARGSPIELAIAGAPDPDNPASYSEADMARWNALPGVACRGWTSDISRFWADAHIGVFPSRGGEGLPKSMLEAAALRRAIVATDAPGCRDFVEHEATGLLAPRSDPAALADAIARLADDAALRSRLAEAAYVKARSGYTEEIVARTVAQAWEAALAAKRGVIAPTRRAPAPA